MRCRSWLNMRVKLCKDIVKARHEKLIVWMTDTVDLFEMANLSEQECLSCITSELIYLAVKLVSDGTSLPPKEFGEMMREALEMRRKDTRERNRRKP